MPVKKSVKKNSAKNTTAEINMTNEKKMLRNPGEIFNLIKYLEAEKVDEFEYSDGDFSIKLKQAPVTETSVPNIELTRILTALAVNKHAAAPLQSGNVSQGSKSVREPLSVEVKKEPEEDLSKFKFVESPIIGTFYRAPSPASVPYVEIGHRVKKGQIVCIVEAMKLMNEIKSDHDGIVERICVENGTLVQAKQRLLYVLPE